MTFRCSERSRLVFGMGRIFGIDCQSRSLPEVVSEDGQTGPDGGPCRALRQHSTQAELAFEHTDRRFDPAAKPLQFPKPLLLLMRCFCSGQTTHLRDANFLNTGLAKLQQIIGTVVSSVRGYLLGLYTETVFCLAHQRKQLSAVVGIATVDLIVNDDSGTILHQLQRAPKLHGLVKLALTDGSHLSIMEGNDPLWYGLLARKLVLGLAEKRLGQFNLLKKLLLELIRRRTTEAVEGGATLRHGMLDKRSHFLKKSSSLFFALLRVGLRCLTPAEEGPLGGPHVAGDLLTQRGCGAGKGLDGLVHHSHIVGVADVSLKGGGVDPNSSRLNRTALQQFLNKTFIEPSDSIFTKSLVELDQGRSVGNSILQRKMAEIAPRQPLSHFPLNFFIAQTPAKLQIHHPKLNPYRCARTAQSLIKNLFKGLHQLRIGQKLIDRLELLVQFIERSID